MLAESGSYYNRVHYSAFGWVMAGVILHRSAINTAYRAVISIRGMLNALPVSARTLCVLIGARLAFFACL